LRLADQKAVLHSTLRDGGCIKSAMKRGGSLASYCEGPESSVNSGTSLLSETANQTIVGAQAAMIPRKNACQLLTMDLRQLVKANTG
jgi:hypothetical protein